MQDPRDRRLPKVMAIAATGLSVVAAVLVTVLMAHGAVDSAGSLLIALALVVAAHWFVYYRAIPRYLSQAFCRRENEMRKLSLLYGISSGAMIFLLIYLAALVHTSRSLPWFL